MTKLAFVVPGFQGSELASNGGTHVGGDTVWVNGVRLGLGGPELLQLQADGATSLAGYLPLLPNERTVDGRYEALRQKLQEAGYSANTFTYDWRLTMTATAQKLADMIAEKYAAASGVTRIVCVGHSMGGLIARLAYPLVSETIREKWDTTLFLGTPHGGSYYAAQAFGGSGTFARWYYGDSFESQWLRRLTSDGFNRTLTAMRSWPALYQLFPPQIPTEFADLDPDAGEVFQANNYPSGHAELVLWGPHAATIHQALVAARATEPRHVCVVGTGNRTLQYAHPDFSDVNGVQVYAWDESHDTDGDEIVHASRAVLSGAEVIRVSRVRHLNMMQDRRILSGVAGWLDQAPAPVPVTIPATRPAGRVQDVPPVVSPSNFIAPYYPASPNNANTLIRKFDP